MLKHPGLTRSRIELFLRDARRFWYEGEADVSATFTHDVDPIPFGDLGNREWRPITVGERWGALWESAWFRFQGEVPADWPLADAYFLVDTESEACVYSPTGEPLCGLTTGDQLSRKALFPVTGAQLEERRASLLVEGAANLGGIRESRLKEARLVRLRRDRWELYHDAAFLSDLMRTLPDDHPRRVRILYALNEAVNRYGRGTPAEVAGAREALGPVLRKPANASADRVTALGHAHMDVAWLWPLRETVRKITATFATALRYMDEYPEYRFGASQPQLYAFVKQHHPGLYERVRQAIADGKWEPQGCMWVEADCNICSGESLVRQCVHGKRFFRDEFGVDIDHLWLPDVFGYSAALPQILGKCGVRYFLTQKISWNQFNTFPHHTFLWEGIDGTCVFTHFPPADTYNGNCAPRELVRSSRNFAQKDRTDRWIYPFGFGDGGGGPSRHHLEALRRAADCEELPRTTQGFARDFFADAEAAITDLPLWRGELYLELHRGTLTTQALSKRFNRRCELGLRDAELLAALAGEGYPAEAFDRLWKTVLLNQFHDIIPGSSIGWVYRDSRAQYEQVLVEVAEWSGIAERAMATRVDTQGDGRPIVLFNTLSWERTDTARVPLGPGEDAITIAAADGQALPTQTVGSDPGREALVRTTVPSVGHAVVFVRPGGEPPPANPLTAAERLLENELLRAEFDEQGHLCRLLDKQNEREVLPAGCVGNRFALYEDKPVAWDAWDVDIYYEEKAPEIAALVSTEVGEAGPIRASVRHHKRVSNSVIRQEVRLAAGSRRLEFATEVDWDETDRMLRTSFPVDVRADAASFEIQYGHVTRPTHRNTSWDMARFEVVAHKWIDLSEPGYGVALLNDCKYGHKVLDNVLDLNLLRSPKSPDPDADIGHHAFTYALLPHAGMLHESDTVRQAYELNVPLRAVVADAHPGDLPARHSWLSLECGPDANVILEVLKQADDGNGLILRLYEAHGRPTTCTVRLAMPVRAARTCSLLEEDEAELQVTDGHVPFRLGRFEIVTVRLLP